MAPLNNEGVQGVHLGSSKSGIRSRICSFVEFSSECTPEISSCSPQTSIGRDIHVSSCYDLSFLYIPNTRGMYVGGMRDMECINWSSVREN